MKWGYQVLFYVSLSQSFNFFKRNYFHRECEVSTQNWGEGIEISHGLPTPHVHGFTHCRHLPRIGTCVIIDEPVLTHHNYSKYKDDFSIHAWYWPFCDFSVIWTKVGWPVSLIMVPYRVFSLPWKSSELHLFIPTSPDPLATTNLFIFIHLFIFFTPSVLWSFPDA